MIRRCYQSLVPEPRRERLARYRRYLGSVEFARARRVGGLGFALRQWTAAVCHWPDKLIVESGGTRLRIRPATSDIRTLEETFFCNQYALPVSLQPLTIIDAGANIGISALYFAQRWPAAQIVALEPEASNFALLQRNVHGCPNVTPLPDALWHEAANLELQDSSADKWGFRMRPSGPGAKSARGLTVPALLDQLGWSRVDLLKIDIEGTERELFADGAPWLARVGTWVLEIHETIAPGATSAVMKAAEQHGFKGTRLGESTWFTRPN